MSNIIAFIDFFLSIFLFSHPVTPFKLLPAAAGTGIVPADHWSVFGGGFRRGAFRLAPRENHLRSRPGGGGGRSNRNSYFENRPDDVGLKNSEQFLKNPVSFIFIFNQRIAPSKFIVAATL